MPENVQNEIIFQEWGQKYQIDSNGSLNVGIYGLKFCASYDLSVLK